MSTNDPLFNQLSNELLDRYIAGECSETDLAAMRRWLRTEPQTRHIVEALRHLDFAPSVGISQQEVSRAWMTVMDRYRGRYGRERDTRDQISVRSQVKTEPSDGVKGVHALRRGVFKQQLLRRIVWSGVVALVLSGVVMMIGWNARVRHISRHAALASLVYTTGNGERANITLPDGGTVTLNVASQIEVPQDFGTWDRTVSLQGQADFRVAHQGGAPFTVEAGGTRMAVLGTEFGVRAYGIGPVQVAVRTGRVMVRSVVLGARDIATVTPGRVMVARNQDLDAALGFTQGRLVLNNVPLREALPDLERWYDVKIQLRDLGVGAIPVHAVLTNGSIGDLMEALRVTLGLHVVCEGRTLTLDRR